MQIVVGSAIKADFSSLRGVADSVPEDIVNRTAEELRVDQKRYILT
jgi:hypothetical protein